MQNDEQGFSFKSLFSPFTKRKAIYWIIAVGLVVFSNAFYNGFVWDDKSYILANPDVHSIINFFNLFTMNLFNNAGQYRPLVAVYFSIVYTFFGSNAFFFHFTQITIHILNTTLLFLFLCLFFDDFLSFILALIFLVHPVQVESVSYIGASASVLLFFFGILALVISQKKKQTKMTLIFMPFLLLLSLLTKETGIAFLIVFILFQSLFKKNKITSFISLGVSLLIYFYLRFFVGGIFISTRYMMPIARVTFFQRLMNVPEVFFYYLKVFFFPLQLSIDQQWVISKISFVQFYLPLLIGTLFLASIAFLGVFLFKKYREKFNTFLFFILWFFVGIGIHLQIIPLDMTVADRWFYFPIVGLLGIFGIVIQIIAINNKKFWKVCAVVCITIVVLLSLRTIARNTNWYDGITLYTHDKVYSDNFEIENNLANEYVNTNQYSKAVYAAKAAVTFFPIDMTLYTLGNSYEQMGNIEKAKSTYFAALQAKDYVPWQHHHYLEIYTALARLLVFFDTPIKAETVIKTGLQDWPNASDLWILLAIAEEKSNSHEDALKAAEKAYALFSSTTTLYIYNTLKSNEKLNLSYSKYGLKLNE